MYLESCEESVWQQSEFYSDMDSEIQIISDFKKNTYIHWICKSMIFIGLLKVE